MAPSQGHARKECSKPDALCAKSVHCLLDGVPDVQCVCTYVPTYAHTYVRTHVLDCALDGMLCAHVLPAELGMRGVLCALGVLGVFGELGVASVIECLVFRDASVRKWLAAKA